MTSRINLLIFLVLASVCCSQVCRAEGWFRPIGFEDPEGRWANEANIFDGDSGSFGVEKSNRQGWGAPIVLSIGSATPVDRIKVLSDWGYNIVTAVRLEILPEGATEFKLTYEGEIKDVQYSEIQFERQSISAVRWTYFFEKKGYYWWLFDLQLYHAPELVDPPVVSSANATSVERQSAVLHGVLESEGGAPSEVRFEYWQEGNPEVKATSWMAGYSASEVFGQVIGSQDDPLIEGGTFYFRAQAKNSEGSIISGAAKSFVTGPPDLGAWLSMTGYDAAASDGWQAVSKVYDDDLTSAARRYHDIGGLDWSPWLYMNRPAMNAIGFRFLATRNNYIDEADVAVMIDGRWRRVFAGEFNNRRWMEGTFPAGAVTQARIRFRVNTKNVGVYWELFEFDLTENPDKITPVEELPYKGSGDGLTGVYFDSLDADAQPKVTKVDTNIFFDWGAYAPIPEIEDSTFRISWTGKILPQFTETYTFSTRSDDGVRLWIGGRLLIDAWTGLNGSERSGTITLYAGHKYNIRMEYFQNDGDARAELLWNCPSILKAVIPTSQLFSDVSAPLGFSPNDSSVVNPAWIDGSVKEDVARVVFSINNETPRQTVRENVTHWYADNAFDSENGTPRGVMLSKDASTSITISSLDADGNLIESKTKQFEWTPTDLAAKLASEDTIRIRKGDSLLLAALGQSEGVRLEVDADGDGVFEKVGLVGERFVCRYDSVGHFVAEAKVDDVSVGTLNVIVVSADLHAPIAAVVNKSRILDVKVFDVEQVPNVAFVPLDLARMDISVRRVTSTKVELNVKTLVGGDATLAARLSGPHGPIISLSPVKAFTITSLNRNVVGYAVGMDEFLEGSLRVKISPRTVIDNDDSSTPDVEGLFFNFSAHGPQVVFAENGQSSLRVHSNLQDADGIIEVATVRTGTGGNCHKISAIQVNSPAQIIGSSPLNNPCQINVCRVKWNNVETNDETSKLDQYRQRGSINLFSKRFHPPSESDYSDGQHHTVLWSEVRDFVFVGTQNGKFKATISDPLKEVVRYDVMARCEDEHCPEIGCPQQDDFGSPFNRMISLLANPKGEVHPEIFYPFVSHEQKLTRKTPGPAIFPHGTYNLTPPNWTGINPGLNPSIDDPDICGVVPCPLEIEKTIEVPCKGVTVKPIYFTNHFGTFDLKLEPLSGSGAGSGLIKRALTLYRVEAVGPMEFDERSKQASVPEPDGAMFPDVVNVIDQAGPFRIDVSGGETNKLTKIINPMACTHPLQEAATRKGVILNSTNIFGFEVVRDPELTLPVGATLRYEWDFGDGNKGEGPSVSHSYDEPGRYDVLLTTFIVLADGSEEKLDVAEFHSINIIYEESDDEQPHPGYMPKARRAGVPIRIIARGPANDIVNIAVHIRRRADMGLKGLARVSLDAYPEDEYLNGFTPESSAKTVEGLTQYFSMRIDGKAHFAPRNGSAGVQTDSLNEDRDGDGNLDVAEDTNGNGVLDSGEDIDEDGRLDVAEDQNGNGILDDNKCLVTWEVYLQGMDVNDIIDNIEITTSAREVRARAPDPNNANEDPAMPICEFIYKPVDWEGFSVGKAPFKAAIESFTPIEDDEGGVPDVYDMVFAGQIKPELPPAFLAEIRNELGREAQEGIAIKVGLGEGPAFPGDDSRVLFSASTLGRMGTDGLRDQENPGHYHVELVFVQNPTDSTIDTISLKLKTNFVLNGFFVEETFTETSASSNIYKSQTTERLFQIVYPHTFSYSKADEAIAIFKDGTLLLPLILTETGDSTLVFEPSINRSIPFGTEIQLSTELTDGAREEILFVRKDVTGGIIEQRVLIETGLNTFLFTDGEVIVNLLFHEKIEGRRNPFIAHITGLENGKGSYVEALQRNSITGSVWNNLNSPVHQTEFSVNPSNKLSGENISRNVARTSAEGIIFTRSLLRLSDDEGVSRSLRFEIIDGAFPAIIAIGEGSASNVTDGSLLDIKLDENGDALEELPVLTAGLGTLDPPPDEDVSARVFHKDLVFGAIGFANRAYKGFRAAKGYVVTIHGKAKKGARKVVKFVKRNVGKLVVKTLMVVQKASEIGEAILKEVSLKRYAAVMIGMDMGILTGGALAIRDEITGLYDMGKLVIGGLAGLAKMLIEVEKQRVANITSGDYIRMVKAFAPTTLILGGKAARYVLSGRFKAALKKHVLEPMSKLKGFVVNYVAKAQTELGTSGLNALPGLFDQLWKGFDKTIGGDMATKVLGFKKNEIAYGLYGFSYLGGLISGYAAVSIGSNIAQGLLTGGASIGKWGVSLALKSKKLGQLGQLLFSVPVKIAGKVKAAKGLLSVGDILGKIGNKTKIDKIVDIFTKSGEGSKLSRLVQRHMDNIGTVNVDQAIANTVRKISDADVAADTVRSLARISHETGRNIVLKNADELEKVGDGLARMKTAEKKIDATGNLVEEGWVGVRKKTGEKLPCK